MYKKKHTIFDVFLFFNELDLLELRMQTLYSLVDYFIITEINETFSGKPKNLIYKKNKNRFKDFEKKIIYNPIRKEDLDELKKSKWSSYVCNFNQSIPHKHNGRPAIYLRSSLKREITHRDAAILGFLNIANQNDIILLSDLDEIPNPVAVKKAIDKDILQPHYFKMDWFLYWMNNKVSEPWFGTVLFKFKFLKGSSLDSLRYASYDSKNVPGPIIESGGWHFSYLGGIERIKDKLKAHPFQGYRVSFAIFLDKIGLRKIKKLFLITSLIFFS